MADKDDPQEEAERRVRDRFERQEEILQEFEDIVDDVKFPTNTAELRAEYREAPDEVVGEEESLGSVLDRLDDEYEDELAAREAILEELGQAEHTNPAEQFEKEAAEVERETTGVVDEVDGEDGSV
ncbi:MAG: hypothetical protein ABEH90_04830 [Halolamina sp.]